jgi:ATP-dependent DNA helicase RecG
MTPADVEAKLDELLRLPAETEWVEFKEAKSSYDLNRIGEYFSALSNEANLGNQEFGWLVFGVEDKARTIVGSQFRTQRKDLDHLKEEIAAQASQRMTFTEIYEVHRDGSRVVMFQIPPALRGVPTAWKGHYYGRDNNALVALSLYEIEQIRRQQVAEDWSRKICLGAELQDLDPAALAQARKAFKVKHPKLADEVDRWDDLTFLNKARICIDGRITNAAIILLGKEESTHFLSPGVAQITWVLKNAMNVDRDYRHFGPPFLLAVDALFANVRNLTLRYLPDGTLFPVEVSQYDPWVLREILHNCIAHQDYALRGRINVVEVEDESILFTNLGRFLPGSVEEVIRRDQPQEEYPNRFLVEAMVNLNMIDTIGSGIRRSFRIQRDRNFPMPTFDLSEPGRVKVRVFGQILDPNYTRMLMRQTNLDLLEVIALDKVQKRQSISDSEFKSLKEKELVEGRRPNLFVSSALAAATGTQAEYIRNRAFDKDHYEKLVVNYLKKFPKATRQDLDKLLLPKLSEALDDGQKENFVTNLLQELRRRGMIRVDGRGKGSRWSLP